MMSYCAPVVFVFLTQMDQKKAEEKQINGKKDFYSLKKNQKIKTKHIFTFNNKMVWSSLGITGGSNNKKMGINIQGKWEFIKPFR